MVKHIVCYKFKDNSRENLDRATEALLSMRFNVPQVLSVEAGADFVGSARSYDLALAVTLKSSQARHARADRKERFGGFRVRPSLTRKRTFPIWGKVFLLRFYGK